MATLIDTHEFTAQCPNCGARDILNMTRRNFNDSIVSFYNCRHCDFSSWNATDYNWSGEDHGPGCDGPYNCTCESP